MNINDTPITWRHLVVLLALALVAAVAVFAITTAIGGDPSDGAASERPSAPAVTERAEAASSEHLAPDTPPADGVQLPAGSTTAEGLPTGFPYSDLGAVAMEVALTKAEGSFDYDQAARAARVYVSPEAGLDLDTEVRRAVAQRRTTAGVPENGEPSAPASYVATPMAFTVAEIEPDLYAVTLLTHLSVTTLGGEVTNRWYTGVGLVDWVEGDWKAVTGAGQDMDQIAADHLHPAKGPDTPEFAQVGWIPIQGDYQ